MTIADMLSQSGILTLLGMCVVFLFLIIMILSMYALHGIIHALHLDKDSTPKAEPQAQAPSAQAPMQRVVSPSASADTGAVVASIVASLYHDGKL